MLASMDRNTLYMQSIREMDAILGANKLNNELLNIEKNS